MASSNRQEYLILLALWLMVFAASAQVIIIAPILPQIGAALDIGEGLQGLLVPAYAFMLSIFALITGPISDKIGRRKILLYGSAGMTVALFLHGFVYDFTSLLLVRAAAGAAGGVLSGASVAYVGDYFPYKRRGWANGWVMSGIAFGQILGIPLGKLLADWINFRWPFLMFCFVMAAALFLIWWRVPQPDVQRDSRRLSVSRALRSYGHLLRRTDTSAAVASYFLMFFSIGAYVIFLPTWLEVELGVTGEQIALLFLVGGLANVVASPAAGTLSDRIGRKPLIVWSCHALGFLMLITTYAVLGFFSAAFLFAIAMITVGMRISPLQSLLTALVPDHERGLLMSLAVAIGQIGIGLGSLVAGIMYVDLGYLSNTILGAVTIMAMALLVQYAVPEPDPKPSAEARSVPASAKGDDAVGGAPASAPPK